MLDVLNNSLIRNNLSYFVMNNIKISNIIIKTIVKNLQEIDDI